MTGRRLVRTIHPVPIDLPRRDAFDPDVPDVAGAVTNRIEIDAARRLRVPAIREQLQPDTPRVTAEESEVDAVHERTRAQRQRKTASDVGRFANFGQVFRQRPLGLGLAIMFGHDVPLAVRCRRSRERTLRYARTYS